MFLYVLLACVGIAQCYPGGQVSGSCGSLMPVHGSNAQTSNSPFTVTAGKTTFKEGDEITVSLNAQSGDFKGFMLQANLVGSNNPIGTFTVTDSAAQGLICDSVANRAVSHKTSSIKTSMQAKWTAPTSGQLGNIEFRATFVRTKQIFWVGVKSSAVVYNGTGTTATVAPTVSSNPDCGKTKVCFSQPSNCDPTTSTDCYFMAVQTSSNQSEMTIEMFGLADGYVAIGFSDDQNMGNDDVYICSKNSSGLLQVQHAYSTGKETPNILSLGNVTNIKTALTNGNINCSFTSRNAISTGSRATSTSQYYLMIASGPSSQGNIQFHTTKYVSSTKADLLNPSMVTANSEEFPAIVKAHGALMLIAWMTTGSIGMMIARYLKGVAKGQCLGGKDFWFLAHVSLMVLSVIATAIAFILVFSYAQDWAGGAHPVLGCIVMVLSLVQPIVAAFRCEPQHERRFIFNWAHSFIALAIKVLSVAAIFTGLELFEEYKTDGWMLKVMGGFITWEALIYILQDLNFRARKKDSDICSFGSMKPEIVLLMVFLLGNLAFLIALLVGIGTT
ncbi:putative ferric-chelate reductase 1 [Rhinichthys klamathensis goyatoka]|uniref:putative ferric-chelate reductase 1 n=1 Tax=Rhinichthys klamathensis goyatoka TaxID=3034132 RepID=UPI0024B6112D|nr:putative ferric-chelate reductase 1 [Rhinichthys klamathensis goyatoka]XP_056105186.1 putative ferric-chelate reductase 1 [Rhinichthys klamathensis goyatoka]